MIKSDRALEICIGDLNRYKFCIGIGQIYYINVYRRYSIGIGDTNFFGQTKALLTRKKTQNGASPSIY